MFEWMAWTLPVAVFFTCIVLMLVGMTVWELQARRPCCARASCRWRRRAATASSSACSPPPTLNLAFVGVSERMVGWFGLEQEPSIWISFVVSMLVLGLILRKG